MLNDDFIESLRVRLEAHPIHAAVQTLDDLRVFMQQHVYTILGRRPRRLAESTTQSSLICPN
jgi:hypothetical protein